MVKGSGSGGGGTVSSTAAATANGHTPDGSYSNDASFRCGALHLRLQITHQQHVFARLVSTDMASIFIDPFPAVSLLGKCSLAVNQHSFNRASVRLLLQTRQCSSYTGGLRRALHGKPTMSNTQQLFAVRLRISSQRARVTVWHLIARVVLMGGAWHAGPRMTS